MPNPKTIEGAKAELDRVVAQADFEFQVGRVQESGWDGLLGQARYSYPSSENTEGRYGKAKHTIWEGSAGDVEIVEAILTEYAQGHYSDRATNDQLSSGPLDSDKVHYVYVVVWESEDDENLRRLERIAKRL
jgi:hypothetical protein